ncbi:DNA cytosine methyltransferase [Agrobacterium sp. P15N1-A]|uniref:DNA cytosine methyltransferase n=1 Tax=Agrobacterium sp. P15N1-A TaxID=3342820 RepID=UPI0037D1F0AC
MVKTSFCEERLLIEKADEIKRKMVKLADSYREISELVRELHDTSGDSILVESLLMVRANIAPADTRLFTNVANLLTENESLKVTTASPETLRALTALPREARSIAVAAVVAGQLSDEEKLQEIESFSEQLLDRREKSAAREREEFLKGLAQALVPQVVEDFEELAADLVEEIREFLYICQSQNSFEGLEFYSEHDYACAHQTVRILAGLVLADFETIFGKVESFLNPPENDSQAGMLANACRALLRFVEGQFGHDGGLALNENDPGFSWELFDAVRYFCTWPTSGSSATEVRTRPSEQLRVQEFGAGAGGMAIGLMAAGFQHVGLLENMKTRLNTLKANWPRWPIRKGLITEVSDEELRRHQGIDLLAGSIPGHSFARKSEPEGRVSEDNHFPGAVRAVRLARPRSEPHRICRRLQLLRKWSRYEQDNEQVFT